MFKRSRALASVALAAVVSAAGVMPAWADTLQEAIALAYRTNPSLLAQRASQRALDENIVQARAGLRPTLSISGGANYNRSESPEVTADIDGDGVPEVISGGVSESDTASVGINLSQNIWTGGRIAHGITAAEAGILAGRENLRSVEQQVLANVIAAYVDVLRDMEILQIRQENLGVLQRQLEEANARFEVGEITRTDVAQAEARLAQSESDLASGQAQLSVSRAAYASVVGQAPADLETPPTLPNTPTDFDQALDVALNDNPNIRSAGYDLVAAEARVAQARAEFLPSVRATASYGTSGDLTSLDLDLAERNSFQAGASLSVPLFTGGLNGSGVRRALEQANIAQISLEGERRTVLQNVSTAYAQMISARSSLDAGQEAVRAASIAAEGVRQEQQVGLRTTLDVLNAELELRQSQIILAQARRNEYVAQAQLLAAMGRLEGPDLDPTLEVYDPEANYRRVRNQGALPWDGVIETIDRLAAPPVTPASDAEDAPIDQQLKSEVVDTAPQT
jgi:outer membrane protein